MAERVMIGNQPEDFLLARMAFREGTLGISWWSTTQDWARKRGWDLPAHAWKHYFIVEMLKTEENFKAAVMGSGIDVWAPRKPVYAKDYR